MTETTDPTTPSAAASGEPAEKRKPRLALFIATAGGLGYFKPGPGTWGSLGGLALGVALTWLGIRHSLAIVSMERDVSLWTVGVFPAYFEAGVAILVAAVGVWASGKAARFIGQKDPSIIVIDEVSGQFLTSFLPFTLVNWKYLLLGFILFRVFDIWKPFPVRQAEKLPGGWGIMADDWVAAIYAAAGLWVARALGL
jgi:phosphatidylglycerophosphatase A